MSSLAPTLYDTFISEFLEVFDVIDLGIGGAFSLRLFFLGQKLLMSLLLLFTLFVFHVETAHQGVFEDGTEDLARSKEEFHLLSEILPLPLVFLALLIYLLEVAQDDLDIE